MDPKNLFLTRSVATLVRIDYLVVLAVCVYMLVGEWQSVNWWHFLLAIAWQDVIGFYPAAVCYYWKRRTNDEVALPRGWYYLYNFVHGVPLNVLVLVVWWHAFDGWQPAMLAIPIHLCVDRGVLGRFYKSTLIAFEPVEHPLFADFRSRLSSSRIWGATSEKLSGARDADSVVR